MSKIKEFILYNKYDEVEYIFKVEQDKSDAHCLNGVLCEVCSWDVNNNKPIDITELAHLYMKCDGCTNWNIYDNNNSDIEGGLWHICGTEGLERFIDMLAFIWKCGETWFNQSNYNTFYGGDYNEIFERPLVLLNNCRFVRREG